MKINMDLVLLVFYLNPTCISKDHFLLLPLSQIDQVGRFKRPAVTTADVQVSLPQEHESADRQ